MTDIFKEIIPSIQQTKKVFVTAENERDYVPFIINRALSYHVDCIMQANQMNIQPSTDNLLQYHYLLNTIRSYKRPFQKWQKKEENENLEAIKEYFQYSNEKARDALNILTNDQLNEIKKSLQKGGLNAKFRRVSTGDVK